MKKKTYRLLGIIVLSTTVALFIASFMIGGPAGRAMQKTSGSLLISGGFLMGCARPTSKIENAELKEAIEDSFMEENDERGEMLRDRACYYVCCTIGIMIWIASVLLTALSRSHIGRPYTFYGSMLLWCLSFLALVCYGIAHYFLSKKM